MFIPRFSTSITIHYIMACSYRYSKCIGDLLPLYVIILCKGETHQFFWGFFFVHVVHRNEFAQKANAVHLASHNFLVTTITHEDLYVFLKT